jgi:hypothetical protein
MVLTPNVANASESVQVLQSIRARAADLASRPAIDRKDLRGPARAIALEWAEIEPALVSDGNAVVETDMLNRAIALLEGDWSSNVGKAPADARKVANAASELLVAIE